MDKNALFIYTHSSTFVRGDISILRKKYNLKEYQFKNAPKYQLPLSLIKLFFYLLFNIYKFNLIYIWFADYHSFLPTLFAKLFGKRAYLVIGGYDVCREKKYNYGSFSKPLRGFMSLNSIKWASCNLCVSANIERTVKAIAPNAKTTVIYNGVLVSTAIDTSLANDLDSSLANDLDSSLANDLDSSLANDLISYSASAKELAQRKVLCVALVGTVQAFYIKGIDRYNRIAALLPHIQFTLVGCSPTVFSLAGSAPSPNLKVVEAVPPEQLVEYYLTSHVYCQFSRRESFSLSLAEAMSYRLIPVISTAGGMPEVTSGLGFSLYFHEPNSHMISSSDGTCFNSNKKSSYYMSNNNTHGNQFINSDLKASHVINSDIEASQLILKALSEDKKDIYRERILQNFTLEKRESRINKTLTTN